MTEHKFSRAELKGLLFCIIYGKRYKGYPIIPVFPSFITVLCNINFNVWCQWSGVPCDLGMICTRHREKKTCKDCKVCLKVSEETGASISLHFPWQRKGGEEFSQHFCDSWDRAVATLLVTGGGLWSSFQVFTDCQETLEHRLPFQPAEGALELRACYCKACMEPLYSP